MDERNDIARDLVESVRKEAIVKVVKAVFVAALAAICACAWFLWTANPLATVALVIVSLSLGFATGQAIGWRRACDKKDTEIEKLKARPTAEETARAESNQRLMDEYEAARREARSAFRSLSVRDMELVAELYKSGARTCTEPDPRIAVLGQRGVLRKAMDSPLIIDLDPKWRARISAFPDVFDEVRGCANQN